MNDVIEVTNLRKHYGETVAVEDVSFAVRQGEIFGIIGPNGAGKTTTVESIVGLRRPDGGRVRVLGHDPFARAQDLAQRIGVQLQEAALPDRMTVAEALRLFSSFYDHPLAWEPLMVQWGLEAKRDSAYADLSGGQKQRLFIALALLNDPEVVFLDELTTGLDPQARRQTWELVRSVRDQGKTVVLVTHFMDEAEALADRIAIIDHGRVIALDRPERLVAELGGRQRLIFEANGAFRQELISDLPAVTQIERDGPRVTVHGKNDRLVSTVVLALEDAGIPLRSLRTEQPDLEDVFLALTGRRLRA